jgi:hypothetical protein
VLFDDVFDNRYILEGIRRIRANIVLPHANAIGCVTVARLCEPDHRHGM